MSTGSGQYIEHEPADDRVERLRERHLRGIALEEPDVGGAAGLGARARALDRGRHEVDSSDVSARTRDLRGQEGDVAAAGADVEDARAGRDPGLLEERAREGPEGLGLPAEAVELLGRVPERVRTWRGGLHTTAILGAPQVDRAAGRT